MTGPTQNIASAPEPASGFKLADIAYVLFRHKWLIAGFIAAGLGAAVAVYFLQRPLYVSEAKLLVRYVVDTKSMETGVGNASARDAGEAIINSEIEILTSIDLCKEVAGIVGTERVLGKKNDDATNVIAAAIAIKRGLTANNPQRSSIIQVRFAHGDPSLCQGVLQQLIESYFKRHRSIHRDASAFDDVLSQQAQQLLVRIRQNEEDLRNLKAQAGVISVEDAKKDLSAQMARLKQELYDAQSKIAEYKSILGSKDETPGKDQNDAADVGSSPETVAEYKSVRSRLDSLRSKEFELLSNFTDENPQVKRVKEQMADNEKRRKELETEFPKLTGLYIAPPPSPLSPLGLNNRPDASMVAGLQARLKTITNQLAEVRTDIAKLDNLESSITDVERKLQLDQTNYMHVAARVQAAHFDEALRAVKMSNIQQVQTPSPPIPNVSKRLKSVVAAFFGLLAAGVGFAFVIEKFLDRTVRRPGEFESTLHLPLFLSIPQLGLNGHAKVLPLPSHLLAAEEHNAAGELKHTWVEDHPLRPYIDGLRDRTLIHFEGDPRKPKLIGVTSCSGDVGVTSIAAGLAGALSETGDGNVLLLNLNFESQGVHPFYRGELTCGLADVLETEKRRKNGVLQNLYVATAGNPADPESQNLSRQLAHVVPKLRVSDYDYIVFDLPPTTPTTMTARLAGMMDLVILVVESGKDTQEAVKQAGDLLSRSKARVSAVLNKVRNPVPRWLHKGI